MFIDSEPNKPEIDYMSLKYVITSLYALKMYDAWLIMIIN